jgi:spoIIIJ-associated protein
VATNPLNPHDRRLVHLALKDDDDLETRSRGEGLLKKVVIIPKNK